MQITYLGHSSFKIRTKTATIVTDPYEAKVGFKFPKTTADILTISHDHFDHNYRLGIKNEDCFVICGPGEYEIKEVMITGFNSYHDLEKGQKRGRNVIYLIESEDLSVCHLGDLGQELTDKQIEQFHSPDIVMVPIGGIYTIDFKTAAKLIKKIDPSYVIPMHYKADGMSEVFNQLATVKEFLDELEIEGKTEERLTITSGSLPEELEVVVMPRKS